MGRKETTIMLTVLAVMGCGEPAAKSTHTNNGTHNATNNGDTNNGDTNNGDTNNGDTNNGDTRQSLVVTADAVTLNGELVMQSDEVDSADVSIALRWNIPDGPFPPISTNTSVESVGDGLTFAATSDVIPPGVAFEPSESNGREGLAIAYVMAFIDVNQNNALDCRNPGDCDDIFVGASPNTLVLYGDPETLTDFSPVFDFDGEPGIVPQTGWSLVHLVPNACEARPTARDWDGTTDTSQVVIIGDFLERERCERRAVNPDID